MYLNKIDLHIFIFVQLFRTFIFLIFKYTLCLSNPCENDDPGDDGLASNVDHPDGLLNVEIVKYGAAMDGLVYLSVNGPRSVAVHPVVLYVTLELSLVVNERLFAVDEILNYSTLFAILFLM